MALSVKCEDEVVFFGVSGWKSSSLSAVAGVEVSSEVT